MNDDTAVQPDNEVTVWFNASCSKCRNARDLLAEKNVEATYVRYLDEAPSRQEIERVISLLGIDNPREMMRKSEAIYKELNLADADPDALIDAMVVHPVLIERPIVIRNDRAVIARPPELLLELLGS
ncbi:MAG: arsenate reductase (glutaredoxin) [Acidimicrobiales bacterium]